jgi:hypothetical protein
MIDLPAILTWDWGGLVKTLVGAGVGSGLVAFYRDRRKDKTHAAYMAMRLAAILEAYSSSCLDLIYTNDAAERDHSYKEQYPDWDHKIPELPPYPTADEGWRAIDRKLANRALTLLNDISDSKRVISLTSDEAPDQLGDDLKEQAARLGMSAWDIARKLRKAHGVTREGGESDIGFIMQELLDNISRKREKERQSMESMEP